MDQLCFTKFERLHVAWAGYAGILDSLMVELNLGLASCDERIQPLLFRLSIHDSFSISLLFELIVKAAYGTMT